MFVLEIDTISACRPVYSVRSIFNCVLCRFRLVKFILRSKIFHLIVYFYFFKLMAGIAYFRRRNNNEM